MLNVFFLLSSLLVLFQAPTQSFAAGEAPQNITYEGRLYNPTFTGPQLGTATFRFEILNPAKDCVLYSEIQTGINLTTSDGVFALPVGTTVADPGALRNPTNDPGLSMGDIFQNRFAITGNQFGGAPCAAPYTPSAGDARFLRVYVTVAAPEGTGIEETLSPDMTINSVPSALVAESIQGYRLEDLLIIEDNSGTATVDDVTQLNIRRLFTDGFDASNDGGNEWHNHDSKYVQIDGSGNVGIGTGTPSANLHVHDSAGFGSNNMISISSTADSGSKRLEFGMDASADVTSAPAGVISASSDLILISDNDGNTGTNTDIVFGFGGNSDTMTETMRMTGDGFVGIGTTTPGAALQVGPGTSNSVINMLIKKKSGQTADLFNVDTDSGSNGNVFTIESDYNIGMGYPTPPHKLSVQDTTTSAADVVTLVRDNRTTVADAPNYSFAISRQNASTPALLMGSDGNSDALLASNNSNLRIGKDVASTFTEYMRIDTSGNVGIGTNAPTNKLEVQDGGFLISGTTGSIPKSTIGTHMYWYPAKAALRAGIFTSGSAVSDANIGNGSVGFGTNPQAASGSIAVGTSASAIGSNAAAFGYGVSAGSYSLAAGHRANASNSYALALGTNVTASASTSMVIGNGVSLTDPLVNNIANSFMIGFDSDIPTLFVGASSGVGTTGNVGIGTSTPLTKLDLDGGSINLDNTSSGRLQWSNSDKAIWVNGNDMNVSTYQHIIFKTWGGASYDEHVRIEQGGNVGIGTTTPEEKLHVSGSIFIPFSQTIKGGLTSGTSNSIEMYNGSTGDMTFTTQASNKDFIFSVGNVGIGTALPTTKLSVEGVITPQTDNTYTLGDATHRFTDVYAVSGSVNTSDRRHKQDIKDSDLGLEFILGLHPVRYHWKDNPERGQFYGVIAQELEDFLEGRDFAGLVYDKESDIYGVRYTEFIAPLIQSTQELHEMCMISKEKQSELLKRTDNLELENKELKREISSLKQEMSELKELILKK